MKRIIKTIFNIFEKYGTIPFTINIFKGRFGYYMMGIEKD